MLQPQHVSKYQKLAQLGAKVDPGLLLGVRAPDMLPSCKPFGLLDFFFFFFFFGVGAAVQLSGHDGCMHHWG